MKQAIQTDREWAEYILALRHYLFLHGKEIVVIYKGFGNRKKVQSVKVRDIS